MTAGRVSIERSEMTAGHAYRSSGHHWVAARLTISPGEGADARVGTVIDGGVSRLLAPG